MSLELAARYIVWALAAFFAFGWTLGVVLKPLEQLKSTPPTVLFWWGFIGLALAGTLSVYHLIWLMPLSLFVPVLFLRTLLRRFDDKITSVGVFLRSLFIVVPAGALAIAYS